MVGDEVDPDGSLSGEQLEMVADDLIAVEWGGSYLAALASLLAAGN